MDKFLKTNEAMAYLKISKRQLFRLRSTGRVKFYQDQNTIWYTREDLDAYVERHVMPTFNQKSSMEVRKHE